MSTFVAFGNLEREFGRMAGAVLSARDAMPQPVVIQAGANRAAFGQAPTYVTAFSTCDFDRFDRLIAEATVVITHGGVGTIRSAVLRGLRPAVFVRQRALGEHIDDHQGEWCQRVFAAGLGVQVHDEASLRHYLAGGQFTHQDDAAARAFFDCSALRTDLHKTIRAFLADS
jgi:UDP-N-acetylglucosamine transferase subunit ALG13